MSLAPAASYQAEAGRCSCSPSEAAALRQGARVELTNRSTDDGLLSDQTTTTRHLGTVLKAGPEGVALANCTVETQCGFENALFGGLASYRRLHRTIGTSYVEPVIWIPIEQMGNVRIVEPPPEGFVPSAIAIDTTPRELVERIGVYPNCFGDTTFELVDAPTGQMFHSEVRIHNGQGPRVIDESCESDTPDRMASEDITGRSSLESGEQ